MSDANHSSATADPDSIAAHARRAAAGGALPVETWDPPFRGDLDMRIARDGTWYYLGTPITRKPMVRLFSRILRKEGGDIFLVTPVEKFRITVDDAPFVAVDFTVEGAGRSQVVTFETHVGDFTAAGPDNPIRVTRDPRSGEPSPYVHVRRGLEALIDRKSFYRLVELGEVQEFDGADWFGLWSGGAFFPIAPAAELN